ncbi:galactose oxidase-like domain-containing protein [Catenulispora pinisilvae]|uniref:galactose oxidase-like domain-containing protein n=1 Tax=Catenulispora pinisilvae TaxID=2705253 RepID=UPI0018913292|nr:galactose oxidase-like domain-containing protein [Catenulispora pinisilvae]
MPFTVAASGSRLVPGASPRVALIRLGARTHGNDMDQRYVWLTVSGTAPSGDGLTITAVPPANPAAAPPGGYQLVVVDDLDSPSPGQMVRITG